MGTFVKHRKLERKANFKFKVANTVNAILNLSYLLSNEMESNIKSRQKCRLGQDNFHWCALTWNITLKLKFLLGGETPWLLYILLFLALINIKSANNSCYAPAVGDERAHKIFILPLLMISGCIKFLPSRCWNFMHRTARNNVVSDLRVSGITKLFPARSIDYLPRRFALLIFNVFSNSDIVNITVELLDYFSFSRNCFLDTLSLFSYCTVFSIFLEMLDFFWKDDGGRSSFSFMIAYVAEGHIAAKYF